MDALSVTEGRLRALFAAGLAVTSELSLDALLNRLVEAAAELTGARYAALGVIDANGVELEQFITHGIDDDLRAEIGDLPRGRGILGVLIREARPLRLHDLAEDPRSVGFPPGHPPMRSFLGVPILLRGVAYGNLYLTEKQGGEDFTDEDEELVTLLAGQAAVAIENARLYEASTRWSRQLQSLQEVGNALATETDLEKLLDLVVRRLRELLGARVVALALPSGGDDLRFAAVAGAARGAARHDHLALRVEERRGARAPAQRAHRLGARRSRGAPGGLAAARRTDRHVGAADRARPGDRRARDPRQGRPRPSLHPRRLPAGRDVRGPRRRGRRAVAAGGAGCASAASCRRRSWSVRGSRASSTTRRGRR